MGFFLKAAIHYCSVCILNTILEEKIVLKESKLSSPHVKSPNTLLWKCPVHWHLGSWQPAEGSKLPELAGQRLSCGSRSRKGEAAVCLPVTRGSGALDAGTGNSHLTLQQPPVLGIVLAELLNKAIPH